MPASRQSDTLTSKKAAAHQSLGNACATCPTQKTLCNQYLDYQDYLAKLKDPAFQSTRFYTSPTVLYLYQTSYLLMCKVRNCYQEQSRGIRFLATNNSQRQAVMLLFVYMHMSMHGLQCICGTPSAITPCWEQRG